MTTATERRRNPRYSVQSSVFLRWSGKMDLCSTRDLSLRGAFLETALDIPLNTPLSLDLSLQETKIKIQAKVVRRVEQQISGKSICGLGVEFLKITTNSAVFEQHLSLLSLQAESEPPKLEAATPAKEIPTAKNISPGRIHSKSPRPVRKPQPAQPSPARRESQKTVPSKGVQPKSGRIRAQKDSGAWPELFLSKQVLILAWIVSLVGLLGYIIQQASLLF